ncbi:putative NPP1 domain protein [Aspergillus nomiae NRRL 13137]|uniref:Putative NPP1 domain protein n=1 Tax=Aspergillus nomiae NRRL (strain ATCC 15546 / NRRL 13137 / CBS 260.88 / M93) TaxID=1509407 RepID=A0A0L1IU24_ASPN3|nr:putative NPP1 domain protein [Aspergillus nomiae NRRL 13137]KNG82992.1 putative NPP1 domain protein [Aspergillus nomiae NRRL 13137]
MLRKSSLLLTTALLGSHARGAVLPRASIDHDAVVGFDQTVPSGTTGEVYLAYQPALYVVNGCVPFPAVDAEGNTNAGLEPTGDPSGNCSSSTGQIYVRGGTSGDYYALMYSWYFPKDEPSTGLGHRHDWEGVIVWLSDSTSTSADNIVAVCPSAHGGWDCSTDGYSLDGTSPLIQYYSTWPVNHQCGLTSTVGGTQPLIAWESLPTAASTALENTDFGDANVPFKDANFASNLGKATF